jgi:hypothetical protein
LEAALSSSESFVGVIVRQLHSDRLAVDDRNDIHSSLGARLVRI